MDSENKARIAFFTAVFSLLCSALVAYLCIGRLLQSESMVLHTHEVQTALGVLNSTVGAAGRNRTGFITTGNYEYRNNFQAALPPIAKVERNIRHLIEDNPKQRELDNKLDSITSERIELLKKSVALKETSSDDRQQDEITAKLVEKASDSTSIIDQMRDEEQRLMEIRVSRSQELFRLTMIILALAMSLALIFFVIHYRLLAEELKARKNAEREVGAKNRELENVNRELETFSYSISHDLRSPIRAIDGFSQALIEDHSSQLSAEGVAMLSRVMSAAQRMRDLIDNLLKLSRVTRGTLKRESIDLSVMAGNIAHQLQLASPQHHVQFIAPQHLLADGDEGLVKIALENLLDNAWKFTTKTPEGIVELGAKQGENGQVIFFVRDNGAGFDMQYKDRLFGPFQRLHPAEEFPGTGIGLATTQRIIRRHGGDIWVEAEKGKGATFFFTLNG